MSPATCFLLNILSLKTIRYLPRMKNAERLLATEDSAQKLLEDYLM